MTAILLDGQKLADDVKQQIATQVEQLDFVPGLGTILVGDDMVADELRPCVKSPKSIEFPVVAIVTNSSLLLYAAGEAT